MTDIKVKSRKKRSPSSDWLYSADGKTWVSPYNYALQSEIDETKKKTQARSCFKACQTCGHCAASRRSCSAPFNYDDGKAVYCEGCEKFGFCDCSNGFLRNAHGEAEPFTEDAQKWFYKGGKPMKE